MIQPSFRRRRDSSELEVFDATRYFSGGIETVGFSSTIPSYRPNARRNFDAQLKPPKANLEYSIKEQEKKCHNQPVSHGFRLVSFLNSLFFPQTLSKTKKKTKSLKDGRRKSKSSSALMVAHKETSSNAIWKQREGEERRKMDGNESDSSSDLFELKSFDLRHHSFGLPAYGTTGHAKVIRRGNASFFRVTY